MRVLQNVEYSVTLPVSEGSREVMHQSVVIRSDHSYHLEMIPGRVQCREARSLLNISRADLAVLSGVSINAIIAFEDGVISLKFLDHEAIRRAFEKHGLEFANGGVRRRRN